MTEDAHAQANAEQVQLLREALEAPEGPLDGPPADLPPDPRKAAPRGESGGRGDGVGEGRGGSALSLGPVTQPR